MMFGITALSVYLAAAGNSAALDAAPTPSGEILSVRLQTRLSSRTARTGQPFSATVVRPLLIRGEVAVPTGAQVNGVVTVARGVGLGFKHECARLGLEFRQLTFPDGTSVTLTAQLAGVDNAREEVDAAGRIRGIRATHELGERMNIRLGGLRIMRSPIAYRSVIATYPLALLPVWFSTTMIFGLTDPEIDLPPGAEFQIRLRAQWQRPERFPVYLGERPDRLAGQEALLAELVTNQPAVSRFEKSGSPGDPVNIVLIGSPAAAFRAAGWQGADVRSRRACFRAMRAVATSSAYSTGPMNTLVLGGRQPLAEWQKGLNTFNKRHHLRAWSATETWQSDPVWLVAATHDTGLVVRGGALTHAIDHRVDRERDKVIADLLLTGCVDAVRYVERPIHGRHTWQTDGQVAVVQLNDCSTARRWDDGITAHPEPAPHSLPWRLLQRVTLHARNTVLRENHAYRAYDTIRHLVLWRRLNRPPAPDTSKEAEETIAVAVLAAQKPARTPLPASAASAALLAPVSPPGATR